LASPDESFSPSPRVLARDLMTRDVISVTPDTSTREVARTLLTHAISAVPVVDDGGRLVGMVSEGDLLGRAEEARLARRDWWLEILAEGEVLSPEFLSSLGGSPRKARDVMTAPVVRVAEDTEASEIARLLADYRIKRVPVMRDGHLVGIVSRADLLHAVADEGGRSAALPEGLFSRAVRSIHEHFVEGASAAPIPSRPASHAAAGPSAADFRDLVSDYHHERALKAAAERAAVVEERRSRVKDLIDHHITDAVWREMLHRAREAAQRGEKEMLLLRFPARLCTDGGRAVNVPDPEWPATLRGEAAEIYLRWERELRPRGFQLTAHVLDFPGGLPGDIGLYLVWDI
jgi:CBS domain-containing protein